MLKDNYKKERDGLQQLIYAIINPIVRTLIRMGVTPNMVTTIGLLGNLASACVIAYAGYEAHLTGNPRFDLIIWAGVITIFFSLFDMLDGQVARIGNMVSRFGALYDSVLDRYSELFTLLGISYYLLLNHYLCGSILTSIALIGSLMVSYVRARAEGLDLECKVGLMQRPERVVLAALGAIFTGVFQDVTAFDPMLILIVPMGIIALLANATAFYRIAHCHRLLNK